MTGSTQELEDLEEQQASEDDSSETPPSDIVAFNELRSCADLVRMEKEGQLVIKPDFQRDIVWNNAEQTRFIDSLVKALPIPSMCLSLDYKTDERLMIDGLQRISSIIKFLSDANWRLSTLEDVDTRISGRTAGYIKEKHSDIFSRIQNLTIPITVLRCDYSKKNHLNYLFTIFHRLNTGGNKLKNQEIRNCIYAGNFNELLKGIVAEKATKDLFGLEPDKSYRYAYEELFLRVFSLAENLEKYNGHLAKFLNEFMDSKKKTPTAELESKKLKMQRTIALMYEKILDGQQLAGLSKATMEAVLVGIYTHIDSLEARPTVELKSRYNTLREDQNFSVENLSEGIASTDKVKARIQKAIEIFA